MSGLSQRLLGLCLPPLLFCLLDGTLTLAGQSSTYWAGDYTQVNEASPTFNHLLQTHPAAFAAGLTVWAAIFVAILLLLPDTLALIHSIAVTMAHTVGAATWIIGRYHYGYQVCNGLFLACAIILGVAIRRGWQAEPACRYELRGWPAGLRWGLATALFCVGVYLFLWPRTP